MRISGLIAATVLVSVLAAPSLCQQGMDHEKMGHDHSMMKILPAAEPVMGASIYQLDLPLVDQHGNETTLGVFAGSPTVITMIYTSCTSACPMLLNEIQLLEGQLEAKQLEGLRVVAVSMDPTRDTPEKLKETAERHGVDQERWRLLAGSDEAVRQLAAVLGLRYRQLPNGDFNHSAIVALLDAEGEIVYRSEGFGNAAQLAEALETLSSDHGESE